MNSYRYEELKIGMCESFDVAVDEAAFSSFLEITGDINPLHNDRNYAEKKGHRDRVAFGMLTSSYLSTLAGVYLPGKLSLIQSVEVKFLKPVILGEKLRVSGEIVDMNDSVKRIELRVIITNEDKVKVLKGRMQVLLDE